MKEKIKEYLKKFWHLLWKDDSLKGWVVSIIFLFIFIKLIFFPILNIITGTSLPLAIVESCSMYHQGNIFSNYDQWFQRHESKYSQIDIIKSQFNGFTFKKGFDKGDILFIIGVKPEKLKIGDIIIFSSGTKGTPIIHRIIEIKKQGDEYIFSTIGDNNNAQIVPPNQYNIDESNIKSGQIVGKAVVRIAPYLGWIKLIFFEGSKIPEERGLCREN